MEGKGVDREGLAWLCAGSSWRRDPALGPHLRA